MLSLVNPFRFHQEITATTITNTEDMPETMTETKPEAEMEAEMPAEAEASSEPVTEAAEPVIEATTEPVVEAAAEPVTEAAVDAGTVLVNESVAEESTLGKRDLEEASAEGEAPDESPLKKEKESDVEAEVF
jgi:hypothetical protein